MNLTKQEFRKKWIEALRSGEYKQGECALRSHDDKYCCLGVACEVYNKYSDAPIPCIKKPANYAYGNPDITGYLPPAVQKAFGLSDNSGRFDGQQDYPNKDRIAIDSSLTTLNDVHTPFSQIADFIESNPKGLFVEQSDAAE